MDEAAEVAESLAVHWYWRRSELDRPPTMRDCRGFVRERMGDYSAQVVDNVAWTIFTTERY